jgi:hypothetical protein
MDFAYIALGLNTLAVFLYKREWLLKKKPFTILLAVNILLLILGYIFQYNLIGNPNMVVALKMPLLSQLIFISLVTIFRKVYNRDPVNTFWTMDISLMKDGIFNFTFWVTAILLPSILVFTKVI